MKNSPYQLKIHFFFFFRETLVDLIKMSEIDKIASLLEDVSIGKADKKDEFVLASVDSELSDLDSSTVELLEAVQQYEEMRESYRLNYVNGFLTLSRANYNSGLSKRFGMESFDLRPYEALKTIRIKENGYEVADESKEADEIKPESDNNAEYNDKSELEGTLKQRKGKGRGKDLEKAKTTEVILSPTKAKNPLDQFGGIVPYQLKQSQQFFVEALEQTVQIKNMETRILLLIKQIETLKQTTT